MSSNELNSFYLNKVFCFHQVVAFETKTTEKYDSSTRIYISVEDANDNPPEFQQNVYLSHVIENVAVGTSVIQVNTC